ncbi:MULTISPECIES: hypothetical protein [unclassified Colwellia]|jgi:hypothetical protein|uniref:hypothetical protein n=1 Tax=unclassified Colwellia TaxID=196834 RepID=UPI0015F75C25|nr:MULTISPECIES: hypothetical protein [unclassified Colwellia]MBA6357499.1 hypothetical protein [Colwellia sp. BRX8-3]MBA6361825.1 hypothetical protein [Colwellia sp. BRX8-6]MBA6369396.1 hypothetical protein [Colwellia sp. BRX8-5]MBA6376801.1 hypothetical protein [Colwellia sp. BRX8-2]
MSHQESNFVEPQDEELGSSTSIFSISTPMKLFLSFISLSVIIGCISFVLFYISDPKSYPSPKELGLSGVFLFFVTSLILIWIPWDKLGLRITKIGGIEFKEIVAEQASENAEEFSYLEERIEYLETKLHSMDDLAQFHESFERPELRDLLLEFLTKYNKWSFSPSRIKSWGTRQQGFSKLSSFEHRLIRSTLQSMVAENLLETRISNKGNTLYRVSML